MKLVVVSGLSGAGKSVVMNSLEDLGYYCVDNLPLGLLAALAAEFDGGAAAAAGRAAVAIDARNPGSPFASFAQIIDAVAARGVTVEVVFLEADDEVLVRRFSETRRRHPLTGADTALGEAIASERELLRPVRDRADLCIDTTHTRLHELRDLVRRRVERDPAAPLSLLFLSFGFKHGVPGDADMLFDVRCLPNPFWEPALRQLTGRDVAVREFLDDRVEVAEMATDIATFLDRWVPRFEAENRAYLTVAIGCTGGHHRSVYLAERLGERFAGLRKGVLVRHRELD